MKYDAFIIGSGQAGNPLAGALARAGQTVALAEGAEIGGSCVNFGCTPSKTIVASARAAYLARRSEDFGVITGEVHVDFDKVLARERKIVEEFRHSDTEKLKHAGVTILRHYAHFEDPHHLRVGDELVEADKIYINTGCRPAFPPIPGLDTVGELDYHRLLGLKALPDHLLIIGGGYIGCEYAQTFRRFGCDVTMFEEGEQILSHEDGDIAGEAQKAMEAEGVRIIADTRVSKAERHGDRVHLTVDHHSATEIFEGSHLLVVTGHVPNSDQLGLDKAGVTTDPRGYIETDDHLRTHAPHIWALGDVNGKGAFTHTSYNDYQIVWDNLNGGSRKVTDRITIYAVFIDPPLGRVGMSEDEVRKSGRPALIGTMKMKNISRAIERDETQGMMKVLVDAETQVFLGAAMVGIEADELIHLFADLMYAKVPYTVLKNAVHSHPTVAELLPTLMENLRPLE